MHGGRPVEDDLGTPAIENDAGIEALEWTRRWYAEGLVSLSNTVKGSQGDTATTLFATDQAGLMLNNPTALPTLQGTENLTLPVALSSMPSSGIFENRWGPIMAIAFLSLLPLLVVFLVFQRTFVQGIASTGLK